MPDITQILSAIEDGDSSAAEELLPLIYDELRKLASARMANESPDHTLQATALVHEAYLRLVGNVDSGSRENWNGRGHFFASAAEAMRRILVDRTRRKLATKHGAKQKREDLDLIEIEAPQPNVDILALNEANDLLARTDSTAAELVKLRFFAGLTVDDCATVLEMPKRGVERRWAYMRSWLFRHMREGWRGENSANFTSILEFSKKTGGLSTRISH